MIRDEIKMRREKTKAAAAKEKARTPAPAKAAKPAKLQSAPAKAARTGQGQRHRPSARSVVAASCDLRLRCQP